MSTTLNNVYKLIAEIIGEDRESFSLILDTDFMETMIDAPEMTSLFEGYYKGLISKETLVYNLRKGKRLDPLRTDAQEIAAINRYVPPVKAPAAPVAKPATEPTV